MRSRARASAWSPGGLLFWRNLQQALREAQGLAGRVREKDTCTTLPGQVGYWVRGSFGTGQLGHFEFEDYVDDSQVIRKRHETGELLLSENQAEVKFEALV